MVFSKNSHSINYSIDSCEEVVGDFEEEMNNYEQIIGHIVDCKDDYFTMVATDYTNYELYIAPN
uniref:Uncharacterized protein n=1 Tax=Meloidogyne javanica TaxID=6303 RepID=A0A915MSB4_MELJA